MNLLLETSGPGFLALFLLSVLSIASPHLTFVALVDGWMNRQPTRRHKSHKKKKTQGGPYSALFTLL
jgi:hypothetical protein